MPEQLKKLLQDYSPDLSADVCERILAFQGIVIQENEIQNLTRLTHGADFYYGHVCDTLELIRTGWLKYPALDLGSGVGVPGILAAILAPGEWVLVESEKRKAEYLEKVVDILGLDKQVSVFSGRGEEYLKHHSTQAIVARAVGPVDRIYAWFRDCSTWNTLILFKGPSWEQEWDKFQKTKFRRELVIETEKSYEVGPDLKQRKLIQLRRVPRGTSAKRG